MHSSFLYEVDDLYMYTHSEQSVNYSLITHRASQVFMDFSQHLSLCRMHTSTPNTMHKKQSLININNIIIPHAH